MKQAGSPHWLPACHYARQRLESFMFSSTQWSEISSNLRRPLVLRWARWLLTVTVVSIAFLLLLPICRRYPEGVHNWFASQPPWQGILAALVLSCVFVFIVFNVLSPRIDHLSRFFFVPPTWTAWAVGALLACVGDLVIGFGPPGFQPSLWEWLLYGPGSIIIVAGYRWLSSIQACDIQPTMFVKEASIQELAENWEKFEKWLSSENPSEIDLLGNRRVARRLAEYVLRRRTIGIVGTFGSGKTTLINWLKDEVNATDSRIWFCQLTCWEFENSTSAIQDILSKAVNTISQNADCFSIRHLPEAYRKTFSAGGDWFRNLIDLVIGSANPRDQFRHLNDILGAIDARLIIVVEELDRTDDSRFGRQEILALLHQLKSLDRVSFILSGGWRSTPQMEFDKLCDHIQEMPALDVEQVVTVIEIFRSQSLRKLPLHIGWMQENPWHAVHYALMSRLDHLPLAESAARLLTTPRVLKHALGRTHRAWDRLLGEINFDALFALNILRHAARGAFDFLVQRRSHLSDDPRLWTTDQQRLPALRKQIEAEWELACRDCDWDNRGARTLLVFCLPSAGGYFLGEGPTNQYRPQGLNDPRYWERAINEEIDPNEARDQDVLKDLRQWLKTPEPSCPLVDNLIKGGDYVTVWENLATAEFQPPGTLLLELADQVMASFRCPRGAAIAEMNEHPAFLALWRRASRIVRRGAESADWLKSQLSKAMPKSLSLVNDLYYYWASLRNGILPAEDRPSIQEWIYTLAQDQWKDGNSILQVAHPEQRYDVYQLVFPPGDHEDGLSPHRAAKDWNWLAPILLEAFERQPQFIAPKIACLVAQRVDGEHPGISRYIRSDKILTDLFDSSSEKVLQLLTNAKDLVTGENLKLLDQILTDHA